MKNNKNNDVIWWVLRIVLPIVLALVTFVYAFGRLNQRVDTLEKVAPKVELHETAIARMEKDLEYIKASVTRIEGKLDERN